MTESSFIIVTLDGGAATGKSSTARALSERLGLMHVDTGAYYRTLTHALLQAGASPSKDENISTFLETLSIDTHLHKNNAQLTINNCTPDEAAIRSPEVNAAVSLFATRPELREFLFEYQRDQARIAREKDFDGLIMEGRDIGSVIFPNADFRFFLHADAETRAARRAKEGITDSITQRDKIDSSRKNAPLVCPEGAIKIDTGPHSLEGVVNLICEHIGPTNA
jgi:cytidylate kinase